ncbi:hypothetical protein, partial [Candidatus Chryseobacterium massiliense]
TGGDYFAGSTLGAANFSNQMSLWQDAAGGGGSGPTPKSGTGIQLGQILSNFFARLFGTAKKEAKVSTFLPGAVITRIPPVEVGPLIPEGTVPFLSFDTFLAGITRAGLWTLPLVLTGDTPEKEQMITLYRGVSVEAKGSMYFYASQGIAIPRGFEQVATTWGPHQDMEAHAGGDNLSIWTSWTPSKETARDFATGVAMHMNGIPGIIMSKQFRASEVVPNPYNPETAEAEWLVPGVVYGAKVEYVLPRPK